MITRYSTTKQIHYGYGFRDYATDKLAVMEHASQRLKTFKTEHFLDESLGVPYLQSIFVKPASIDEVVAEIKAAILDCDEVDSIIYFDYTFDATSRKFTAEFQILTDAEVEAGLTAQQVLNDTENDGYAFYWDELNQYWTLSVSKLGYHKNPSTLLK